MRILHVVQPPRGGAPALVEMLAPLQAASNEVGVVCRPRLARRLGGSGVRVWSLPMLREISPLDDFRQLGRLARIVRSFRPDVIHAHSSKAGVLGRIVARGAGVPLVFSPHNFAHTIHEGGPAVRSVFLAVEAGFAPLTTVLHLTYGKERDDALRLGLARPDRVAVIPNGIDVDPLLGLGPPRGDPPVIGTYARLWPQKSIDVLLEAAAILSRRGCGFRVYIAGEGPERESLERRGAALGLEPILRFRDDEGRLAALEALDVYVLSSSNEAFPLVPIEAMAAGRPVVATEVGAVPEIVEQGVTGFVVPPGDAAALADAIEPLLADPELRREIGARGRQRADQRFRIEGMSSRLEELYREACQCASTSSASRARS